MYKNKIGTLNDSRFEYPDDDFLARSWFVEPQLFDWIPFCHTKFGFEISIDQDVPGPGSLDKISRFQGVTDGPGKLSRSPAYFRERSSTDCKDSYQYLSSFWGRYVFGFLVDATEICLPKMEVPSKTIHWIP